MPYTTNRRAQYVWVKARHVKGKNPSLYRRDYHGNVIYKPAYGKTVPWAGRSTTFGPSPRAAPMRVATFKRCKLLRTDGSRTKRQDEEALAFEAGVG